MRGEAGHKNPGISSKSSSGKSPLLNWWQVSCLFFFNEAIPEIPNWNSNYQRRTASNELTVTHTKKKQPVPKERGSTPGDESWLNDAMTVCSFPHSKALLPESSNCSWKHFFPCSHKKTQPPKTANNEEGEGGGGQERLNFPLPERFLPYCC